MQEDEMAFKEPSKVLDDELRGLLERYESEVSDAADLRERK